MKYILCELFITCIFINFPAIQSQIPDKQEIVIDITYTVDNSTFETDRIVRLLFPYILGIKCTWERNMTRYVISKLNWTKNGQSLVHELSTGRIMAFTNISESKSELRFTSPIDSDEGIYTCISKSYTEKIRRTGSPENITFYEKLILADGHFQLTKDMIEPWKDPLTVRYSGPLSEVLPGENISIECTIDIKPDFKPNFTFNWTRSNKPIPECKESTVRVETNVQKNWSKISITNVCKDQAGYYRCLDQQTTFYKLEVPIFHDGHRCPQESHEKYVNGVREFFRGGEAQVIDNTHEGKTVAACIDLEPEEPVYWTRNGQPIEELSSGYMKVVRHENVTTLHHEVNSPPSLLNLIGKYRCIPKGQKFHEVQLKESEGYIGSTRFGGDFDSKKFTIFIQCNLTPEDGEYAWKKDNVPIHKLLMFKCGYVSEIRTLFGSMLLFERFHPLFMGRYKCLADDNRYFELDDPTSRKKMYQRWMSNYASQVLSLNRGFANVVP